MAHSFLAILVGPIPQTTKDNVPTFWQGVFSNDGIMGDDGKWRLSQLIFCLMATTKNES